MMSIVIEYVDNKNSEIKILKQEVSYENYKNIKHENTVEYIQKIKEEFEKKMIDIEIKEIQITF